ncbi:hypothetical protein RUM44_000082 [Polyplax serrata]|uniref:DUF243 domain-containing protein n=1 Tax=Polyplax serrata TaxID=468196 RepID=A0ABR1B4G0_POLSC
MVNIDVNFIAAVLCTLFVVCLARPEPPAFGGYPSSGLDSYAAPIGGSAPGGGYPAPAPQYGAPAQAPVVHKHVYVHVPPPEAPEYKPRKHYPAPIPRKHYKIVFIKAPTPPTPTVPDLPPVVQDEQKTLIYVLVKRPEEQPEITIPTPAPTKPSKPEVYFIRYRTQKEQGGYPDSGVPVSQFSGASAPSGSYGAPSAGGY